MPVPDFDIARIEQFYLDNNDEKEHPAFILYTPNTYHYTLLNLHNLEEYLYIIHQQNDLMMAEISEDVFGIVPVINYHKNPDPVNKLLDRILALEDRLGMKNISVGTGADLYSVMQMTSGHFDGTEANEKKKWQTYLNIIKIVEYLGIKNINGHRVATIYPEQFDGMTLGSFRRKIGREDLDLGGLDPDTEITGAEAKNLELALMLQDSSDTVSSTTEIMYQPGMEPRTVEQTQRFFTILQANSDKPVFAHMDTGHIVVSGKGKKPADYDIMAYADIRCPRWTVHFNSLYKNEHRMPTKENIETDLRFRDEEPDPVRSPHPELYGNVYDWLKRVVDTSRVVQVAPEPKPMNLETLIKEVGECWEILKKEYADTHKAHQTYKGLLIPNSMYDEFIKKFG